MREEYPTLEPPETYLSVVYDAIALVCVRKECRIVTLADEGTVLSSTPYIMTFPQKRILPETLVMVRADHVANHTIDITSMGDTDGSREVRSI